MLALLLILAGQCTPPRTADPVVLLVVARDPAFAASVASVERTIRVAASQRISLLPPAATQEAITAEGGRAERERTVIDARIVLDRAEEKFRELDDEEALDLIAKATTRLSAVHHAPGAIEQLSRAHLLAGAIYLARGRADAARQRLQRALDLDPTLSPPRDRYAPELFAEIAAVRAAESVRATGRLVVTTTDLGDDTNATVYLDGRPVGTMPLELDAVPVGNHLLRVHDPKRSSAISSIQITANEALVVHPSLTLDPEQLALERLLNPRGSTATELSSILALFAERAGAERALLATIDLADAPTPSGTATISVSLELERTGVAIAKTADRPAIEAALDRALACAHERLVADRIAPALLGRIDPRATALAKVPPPETLADKPWFWGAIFIATIAAASTFVVARTSGGPPESVEVRLIPRP